MTFPLHLEPRSKLLQPFGLDALDVGLLAAASDEETRQKLHDSLAKIIEVVGANSQVIEELAGSMGRTKRLRSMYLGCQVIGQCRAL